MPAAKRDATDADLGGGIVLDNATVTVINTEFDDNEGSQSSHCSDINNSRASFSNRFGRRDFGLVARDFGWWVQVGSGFSGVGTIAGRRRAAGARTP